MRVFQYVTLCKDTRRHALDVVRAFRHVDSMIGAPIAGFAPHDRDDDWAHFPDAMMTDAPPSPQPPPSVAAKL